MSEPPRPSFRVAVVGALPERDAEEVFQVREKGGYHVTSVTRCEVKVKDIRQWV